MARLAIIEKSYHPPPQRIVNGRNTQIGTYIQIDPTA